VANRIQDANQAATALESYFLRRVLSEVRSSEEGLLGGGFAGGMFKEMFDEAVADSMSAAGGVGIGQVVAKQLDPAGAAKTQHASTPPPHTVATPASQTRPATVTAAPTVTATSTPTVTDTATATPTALRPANVTIRRAYSTSATEPPSSLPIPGRTTDGR
jgi:Rod binding domain-containing protein